MTTVNLRHPVARGETRLTEIALRRPRTGELRGLKLAEVMVMEVSAMIALIPRISDLTGPEVAALDPRDFTRLCVAVLGFFGDAEMMDDLTPG